MILESRAEVPRPPATAKRRMHTSSQVEPPEMFGGVEWDPTDATRWPADPPHRFTSVFSHPRKRGSGDCCTRHPRCNVSARGAAPAAPGSRAHRPVAGCADVSGIVTVFMAKTNREEGTAKSMPETIPADDDGGDATRARSPWRRRMFPSANRNPAGNAVFCACPPASGAARRLKMTWESSRPSRAGHP